MNTANSIWTLGQKSPTYWIKKGGYLLFVINFYFFWSPAFMLLFYILPTRFLVTKFDCCYSHRMIWKVIRLELVRNTILLRFSLYRPITDTVHYNNIFIRVIHWKSKGTGRLGNKRKKWTSSRLQHYQNWSEYWEEFWRLEETYSHSNSFKRPSANAGVKNSQGET